MKTILLFLFCMLVLPALTQKRNKRDYKDLRILENSQKVLVVVGEEDTLSTLSELNLDMNLIISDIKNSTIPDKALIVQVLSMITDEKKQLHELVNLSKTYQGVSEVLMKRIYEKLPKKKRTRRRKRK